MVLSGIEDHLLQQGYFYLVVSHRHDLQLLETYRDLLRARCIEGVIAVDTPFTCEFGLPAAAVSRHEDHDGVTNIVLNHEQAARLALEHLASQGHDQIAFIKGQEFSSDTEVRWQSICRVAEQMGLTINPLLVAQLTGNSPSPELGYVAAQELLASREPFTALFAFNDVSAMGAISAFCDAGHRVPEDISVVGFDDVYSAAYQNPPLTTIRQPLRKMGKLAAEVVLQRVTAGVNTPYQKLIVVEPELVIRKSVCRSSAAGSKERKQTSGV
jgi:LacI family transcriptional regulator